MLLKINNNNPDTKIINQAVKILDSGGVLVAPTETAYGLIADATNKKAINKIYKIKGRDFKKFLPLIAGSNCQLREYFKVSGREDKIIKKYKGVSIILPIKNKQVYLLLNQENCAVRVSTNKVVQQIAKKLAKPITATSANQAGKKTCYSVGDILKQLKEKDVDLILDAGKLANKKSSTIVKVENKEIKVLRQGEIRVKL